MNTYLIILIAISACVTVLTVETINKYVSVGKNTLSNTDNNNKKRKVSIHFDKIIYSIMDNKVYNNNDLKDIYHSVSNNSISYIDFLKTLNAEFMLSSSYKSETYIQKFKSIVSTAISEEQYKEHFESISADDKLSIESIVKYAEEKDIDKVIKPELDKLAISLNNNQKRITEESIRNKLSIYVSIGSLIITVISLIISVVHDYLT